MNEMQIVIASVPDRDFCVVELWRGDVHVAEVRQKGTSDLIQFYTNQSEMPLEFDLTQLIETLNSMKRLIRKAKDDD